MLDTNPIETYSSEKPVRRENEQALIKQYLPLVHKVVRSLRSQATSNCSVEDMQQIALCGLLESIRRFEDGNQLQFLAFARQRMRGAILDELRSLDWRSRNQRQQSHDLKASMKALTVELGRDPSNKELQDYMGITSDELDEKMQMVLADEFESFDKLLMNGFDYSAEPETETANFIDQQTLAQAIAKLPKRDQLLLTLFYRKELNFKEIGLVLGLTSPRICQLHKEAINHLREILTQD